MKTILFVSTDNVMRKSCQRMLEDEDYRVVLARDAVQAVAVWKPESPDAIILYNLMPHQEALQAAEEIGTADPDVPIILYAGFDDTYVRDARVRFVIACLDKNADMTELKVAVRRAVSSEDHGKSLRVGLPPLLPDTA